MEKRNYMIVYNAEPLGYSEKAIQNWHNKGYNYTAGSWDVVNKKQTFEGVETLIVRLGRKINAGILDKFPGLKNVVTATTGTDHIELNDLKKRGIKLYCLKEHSDFLDTIPSTAEHTWALIMSLIRNIPAANENVKAGIWNRDKFRGNQLKNKTIGIIGLGRTGKKIAEYATAFAMKVQYYDPYVSSTSFKTCLNLTELLRTSDIISLHVHLNEETKEMVNFKNIKLLKKGCLLINTSRGKVWDEQAVAFALKTKLSSGVATDVLSTELENVQESLLWKLQNENYNIIITPHIGGATWEAMWACEEYLSEII
jgi:D-3-phosphoglycerate dehydrogenase